MSDSVNHPSHYLKAAVTIEPIELTSRMTSCIGQALQYVCRAPYKDNEVEDLKKAVFYLKKQLEVGDYVYVNDSAIPYIAVFSEHSKENIFKRVLSMLFSKVYLSNSKNELSPFYYEISEECLQQTISFLEARIRRLESSIKSYGDPIGKDEEF